MKRIALIILAFCLAQTAIAQEEVAIETVIKDKIHELYINSGWNVRLTHRDTDSTRIAIVTEEKFAGIALDVELCNLTDSVLTILENTMLPKGTLVEIEGNMAFRSIKIQDNAKVVADCINYYPQTHPLHLGTHPESLELGAKAQFDINSLYCIGCHHIKLGENSHLNIRTITGNGKLCINTYNADFQYETSLLDGKVVVNEYESPNWFYVKKNPKIIETKMVDGRPVTTERHEIWDHLVGFSIGIGYRNGDTPVNLDSPYSKRGGLDITGGVGTCFTFSPRWKLNTGLLLNNNLKWMSYPVELGDNGLEIISQPEMTQHNTLVSNYLCIPIELYYYLDKQKSSGLSLDFRFGRLINGLLFANYPHLNNNASIGSEVNGLFNPWKIEIGMGFNTNILGIIHGIRIYTNLLPEYNKNVTNEKFRSIGFEIRL